MNYNEAMDELVKQGISVCVDFNQRRFWFQQLVGNTYINLEMIDENQTGDFSIYFTTDDDFKEKIIKQVEFLKKEDLDFSWDNLSEEQEFFEEEYQELMQDYQDRYNDFQDGLNRMGREL